MSVAWFRPKCALRAIRDRAEHAATLSTGTCRESDASTASRRPSTTPCSVLSGSGPTSQRRARSAWDGRHLAFPCAPHCPRPDRGDDAHCKSYHCPLTAISRSPLQRAATPPRRRRPPNRAQRLLRITACSHCAAPRYAAPRAMEDEEVNDIYNFDDGAGVRRAGATTRSLS